MDGEEQRESPYRTVMKVRRQLALRNAISPPSNKMEGVTYAGPAPPSNEMEGVTYAGPGLPRSNIYQVPLNKVDVSLFKNPPSQAKIGAMNCASVTAQLLGLLTSSESENHARLNTIVNTNEMIRLFQASNMEDSKGSPFSIKETKYSDVFISIKNIEKSLWNGFATPIGLRGSGNIGHFVVLAKSEDIVYILDPQERIVIQGLVEIHMYIEKEKMNSYIDVFTTSRFLSEDDFRHAYLNGPLARTNTCVRSGGKRKKRKTRRRLFAKRAFRRMSRHRTRF
jgi:hypothetical protein